MRGDRTAGLVLLALLLLGAPSVVSATDGFLVNEKQEPIVGARVCYWIDNVELFCNLTDSKGRFELPVSQTDTLRAHAEGYNPVVFSAAGQAGPVTLKRAPVLSVRLIDEATGERIEKGEVIISYPSGKELGPFPANKAGLRIRRGLNAGEIRVVGKADGFRTSDPVAVTLEAGEESVVAVKLSASASKKPSE